MKGAVMSHFYPSQPKTFYWRPTEELHFSNSYHNTGVTRSPPPNLGCQLKPSVKTGSQIPPEIKKVMRACPLLQSCWRKPAKQISNLKFRLLLYSKCLGFNQVTHHAKTQRDLKLNEKKKFNRHQHWNEGYIRISGKDLKILRNSSMSNNNHAWKT